ncbi:MAG TPA: hypothetical protein VJ979_06160 [Actinomycetota bacterium]|nr:hypothetical protein [Actinomycetota bacterium]
MTISIYDLEILTDAMVFAVLVTIGGVVSWAFGRELSRRYGPRREVRVALAGAALIAVGAAAVAVRSTAGDALPIVARVASAPAGDRVAQRPALRLDEPESSSDGGRSSRLEGSIPSEDAVDSLPVAGSAAVGAPAADPGTIPGSHIDPSPPPPVGEEPSDDPPVGEPSDDPPAEEPSDDPPAQEPSDDPPTEEPSDDEPQGPDGEGPPGQGPDGEGPPGQDGGGPPGQGGAP